MLLNFTVTAGVACLFLAVEAHAEQAPLADIMAAEQTDSGISVTVPTGGCTKKADFEVSASPVSTGAAQVEIRRLKRDYCKGNFPDGLKVLFTWDDLKLAAGTKVTITNLAASQPAPPKPGRKASAKGHKKFKRHCKRSRGKHHCKARRAKHAFVHEPAPEGAAHAHHRHHRVRARHHHRHRSRCHF